MKIRKKKKIKEEVKALWKHCGSIVSYPVLMTFVLQQAFF